MIISVDVLQMGLSIKLLVKVYKYLKMGVYENKTMNPLNNVDNI